MVSIPTNRIITDEALLARPRIGPQEAAEYLQNGTTAQEIRVLAQNGACPFCKAVRGEGRWKYRVVPGLLIAYKRGELGL